MDSSRFSEVRVSFVGSYVDLYITDSLGVTGQVEGDWIIFRNSAGDSWEINLAQVQHVRYSGLVKDEAN